MVYDQIPAKLSAVNSDDKITVSLLKCKNNKNIFLILS